MDIANSVWDEFENAAKAIATDSAKDVAIDWAQDFFIRSRNNAADADNLIRAIDDCDPEIMDRLPYLDLSGQWADGITADDILSDIANRLNSETLAIWNMARAVNSNDALIWDCIIDTYDNAYNETVQNGILDYATQMMNAEV